MADKPLMRPCVPTAVPRRTQPLQAIRVIIGRAAQGVPTV